MKNFPGRIPAFADNLFSNVLGDAGNIFHNGSGVREDIGIDSLNGKDFLTAVVHVEIGAVGFVDVAGVNQNTVGQRSFNFKFFPDVLYVFVIHAGIHPFLW